MTEKKVYKKLDWTSENVKKFWDYEAQFPENYFTFQVGQNLINVLQKYFPKGTNVLDYGSGPGFLIPWMMKKGLKVSALEFSDISKEEVKKKFSSETNFVGALTPEEIRKSGVKYDLIVIVEVIEHLDEKYLSETFDNVREFLADDGVAIFTTPHNENLDKSMIYCPNCDNEFHRWQHMRNWTKEKLTDYITFKKFEVVDVFATNFSKVAQPKTITLKGLIKNTLVKLNLMYQEPDSFPHLVGVVRKKAN